MADVSLGIFGLGRAGASVGLALKRYNAEKREHRFTVTGYDSSHDNGKNAKSLGALDAVESRPENVAREKNIILLAAPYGETEALYNIIGANAQPGVVVIDFSALKAASLKFAQEHLGPDTHLICAAPIVNPKYLFDGVDETSRASADYFDKGEMMIMPGVSAAKEAIALSADFAKILGARPHYYDASEHDALAAAVDALPAMVGLAYFRLMASSHGWNDLQRMTNPAFGMLTRHLYDTHPDDLRDIWLDASDDLVRHVEGMIDELKQLRVALLEKDSAALEAAVESSSREFEIWINRRHNALWKEDEQLQSKTPSFGSMVGNMFGAGLASRLRGGDDDDE